MSNVEYLQWMEYYKLEPFHADRSELQLAQISDIIVKTAGEKDSMPVDFMLSVSEDDKDRYKAEIKHKKVIDQLKNF